MQVGEQVVAVQRVQLLQKQFADGVTRIAWSKGASTCGYDAMVFLKKAWLVSRACEAGSGKLRPRLITQCRRPVKLMNLLETSRMHSFKWLTGESFYR